MKCKYENKNGTCGLKRSYAYRHKCFTEDLCKCFEPLSNADRIRNMSDEELAEFLCHIEAYRTYGYYAAHGLDWLRRQAEGDNK